MKIKIFFIFMLCFASFAFAEEDLSALLGGSVQSDRWLINRDKEEEEFIGNVSYSNEIYSLKADYALSQRKQDTYLLKGNITASQTLPDSFIQIKAEKIFYNNKTLKGYAFGKTGKQVEGIYKTPNNTFSIFGDRIDFDKKEDQINISSYAELNDLNNTIYGDSIAFNTQSGFLEVFGKRPVLWGFGVDGDYALQADKMTADTKKGIFKAQGNVAGWITLASDFEKIKQVTSKK
jgi:Uncharacterized protein conserved in bacteria